MIAVVGAIWIALTGPSTALEPEDLMKKWQCIVCGFIYDEAAGLPDEGIAPGTPWEQIPEDWQCPECGVAKSDFEMVEF